MECPPTRAQAWLDDHERELDGLGAEEASALIASAGLEVRLLPRTGAWMTEDLRDDRVNLWLDELGGVRSRDAG